MDFALHPDNHTQVCHQCIQQRKTPPPEAPAADVLGINTHSPTIACS